MSRKYLVPLQLPADPTQPLEAATKQYVDGIVVIAGTDPIGTSPTAELWYDTSVPSGAIATNAPLGFVGRHSLTTIFTTTGTHTTLQTEGLQVVVDEPANRWWKVTLILNPWASGGANGIIYSLQRNGIELYSFALPLEAMSAGSAMAVTFTYVFQTVAATGVTYRLQLRAGTSNAAVASWAAGQAPRILLIEDIGGF